MALKRLRYELTPPSDRDGDSTMHSSPNHGSDDEMFPDEALPNNPATPHNTNLTLIDELSPPSSQSRDPASLSLGVNSNGKRPLSTGMTQPTTNTAGGVHRDNETGYEWSRLEDQPGYEWRNTRAREEEARALDNIVDKGSMIRRKSASPIHT
jgi:hypothetical protein